MNQRKRWFKNNFQIILLSENQTTFSTKEELELMLEILLARFW